MTEELERFLLQLTEPDNAVIQQVGRYLTVFNLNVN